MRKISATMATQHPDNAQPPFWNPSAASIDARKEFDEAIVNWRDLGIDECMWDWEGKHADAAIIDRLLTDFHSYFNSVPLGREKFLTFRLPNMWQEKGYNLMQAMAAMLSGEDLAHDLNFKDRPLFEAILPMTERADQLLYMQELFEKLVHFKASEFAPQRSRNNDYLEMIPLIESVESQHKVTELLNDFFRLHQAHFGSLPQYLRVFLACSDPAIGAGHLATVLANKIGLSDLHHITQESGVPIYPITGSGSLPFRGGLTPDTIDRYVTEFPGVRTVTLQSAFRYDYPKEQVIAAVNKLATSLPTTSPLDFSSAQRAQLLAISDIAQRHYQGTLAEILPDLEPYFAAFPKRRERRLHIDLVGYGRTVGKQKVPRAITFTGSMYSIGVPPELIGIGRALRDLSSKQSGILHDAYPHLQSDLQRAGSYLNKQNLEQLSSANAAWKMVKEDVDILEHKFGVTLESSTKKQKLHQQLTAEGRAHLAAPNTLLTLIEQMAIARQSLG